MSEEKRQIFEGPLRRLIISTTQRPDTYAIYFNLYQDHFLEAVARWPWLLCNDLGEHDTEFSYLKMINQIYGTPNRRTP